MKTYWDVVAKGYDLFEEIANKKVYEETGKCVAKQIKKEDTVLECACGTGAISKYIAPQCKHLVATDFSMAMLKQTQKKLSQFQNITIQYADITHLPYPDEAFDKVVAGNVIHLLDDPYVALNELFRVCKENGKVILPTYMNMAEGKRSFLVKLLDKSGAGFKRQFSLDSYKVFFQELGYQNVSYELVMGKMPCAIAIIPKENKSL